MKFEIDVMSVTVLRTFSTDRIVVKFVGEPQYPNWLPEEVPFFSIEVARGNGVAYAKKMFSPIKPIIIDTTAQENIII